MDTISVEQFLSLPAGSFLAVDLRDETAFSYGSIENAVCIPYQDLSGKAALLPRDKLIVLFCKSGIISEDAARELRGAGYNAVSLKDGYYGYMLASFEKNRTEAVKIEKSIQTVFHKELWSPFAAAIKKYELIREGDKIAVCISGGKDSMLMAKLFQEILRHGNLNFEAEYLVMDPGYSPENRNIIVKNLERLNIPATIFSSDIFENVYSIDKSPCYVCARMRRGYLYSKAQELGCNKIALGHHYDDVIETILMGLLYGGQMQTMMPKLKSTNFPGMELIRPMYLIREQDIIRWRDRNKLHFLQCACRFTDTCTSCNPDSASKRQEIKNLIREMKKTNPQVEKNLFKSVENVNLDTLIAWKQKGTVTHFLDNY